MPDTSCVRILLLLSTLLCPAYASPGAAPDPAPFTVESAMEDYENLRYDDAVKKLRVLADRGDARAQYSLGLMYRRGHGVPLNNETAIEWYRKAAAQGHSMAENNLGFMYFKGLGVEVDKAVGYGWYLAAARHGQVHAQYNVGLKLFYGDGVSKDPGAALEWFLKASLRGCREAIHFTGTMYEQGIGTAVDPARAALWFKLGEEAGESKSAASLEEMRLQKPDVVADAMSRYPEFRRTISIETEGVDPGGRCDWR